MKARLGIGVLGVVALLLLGACGNSDAANTGSSAPPQIPENFTWTGRYVVPDLDLEVPFTWQGSDGNFQMIAGGESEPIHFTNIIQDGQLYTLTYTWPDIPRLPCSHVGSFTLDELNEGFAQASFVGRETLHGDTAHEVNHFRSVSVIDIPPEAIPELADVPAVRIPVMSGDIYVDAEDSSIIRRLLHFGVQNLYDPNLDEWIMIDEANENPGQVELPEECV